MTDTAAIMTSPYVTGVIELIGQLAPLLGKLISAPSEQHAQIISDEEIEFPNWMSTTDKVLADMDETKAEALKAIDEIPTKPL